MSDCDELAWVRIASGAGGPARARSEAEIRRSACRGTACADSTLKCALHIHQKLWNACWYEKTAEAKRLIAEGAPVDWQQGRGWAPLHTASGHGYTEIVMLLLENKCNINITTNIEDTPLILAAYHDKMDTVRALVEAGCDISIRGEKNKTAAEQANKNKGRGPIANYLTIRAPNDQVI